jgi:hypothetical protein
MGGAMKASEVTEEGYYWAWQCGAWHVVPFYEGFFQYGDGSGESVSNLAHDFEVIGPLVPPSNP